MSNTLDRLESLAISLFDGDKYHDRATNGERLAEALSPLIPVLKFWAQASDQYEREKGLANTPYTTIAKCNAADEALREALRSDWKIKIRIDDPETRAVWETAQKAKAEVASWPPWKRGVGVATWCPQCGPPATAPAAPAAVACASPVMHDFGLCGCTS
jgi:hypothetical protein